MELLDFVKNDSIGMDVPSWAKGEKFQRVCLVH
jgi:hypothetical protein